MLVQAQHDDLCGRILLEQCSGGLDSVQVGHGDIENEYIGGPRPGRLEHFQAVGGLADDHDRLSASFDRQAQPVPDHRMIVGNDNANGTIADCGLRIADCGLFRMANSCRQLLQSAIRNPQSAIRDREAHAHRGSFALPGINREGASDGNRHFVHHAEAHV